MEEIKEKIEKVCNNPKILDKGRVVLGNSYSQLVSNLRPEEELVAVYQMDGAPITPVVTNRHLFNYFEEKSKNGYLETVGYLAVATDLLMHIAC
jgi:hypothetical protein